MNKKSILYRENENGYSGVLDGFREVKRDGGGEESGRRPPPFLYPPPHLDHQSINNILTSTILISNDQVQIKTA